MLPEAAMVKAKKAIESTYIGTCDVVEYVHMPNMTTKISEKSEKTVLSNQPCRLSFDVNNNRVLKPTLTGETASEVRQNVKLFISPEVEIKPGSKIIVTQNGVTTAYKKSGQPSVYSTHQEIMLELYDDLA